MRDKFILGLLCLACLFGLWKLECHAEIAGDDAFSNLTWELVYEENIQGEYGVVQSICATEDYIICIENTTDGEDVPDVVSAYYKNDVDKDGNPVEKYSLAKRVSDTNWEHGNGMAYNPNTHEIYVALYTNMHPENRGCLYVMDPDTLAYKRTIKVSDDYNVLGIDYDENENRYIIQTNVDGGYSFKILGENFQEIEDLGSYADTAKGNNFQDLVLVGDYIMNFPLTLNLGIGDFLHVYSISRRAMIADPQIDFKFENIVADEPESLCEIEEGVYLSVVNVTDGNGTRMFRFYQVEIPYYFQMNTEAENGKVTGSTKVLGGEDYKVSYNPDDGYRISELTVDGKEKDVEKYETGYVLKNIRADHNLKVIFEKKFVIPIVVYILVILFAGAGLFAYSVHVKMVRRRKYLRTQRKRRRLAREYGSEL